MIIQIMHHKLIFVLHFNNFKKFLTSQSNKSLTDYGLHPKDACTVVFISLYHVLSWTSCACVYGMVSGNGSGAFLSVCDDLATDCETGDLAETCNSNFSDY